MNIFGFLCVCGFGCLAFFGGKGMKKSAKQDYKLKDYSMCPTTQATLIRLLPDKKKWVVCFKENGKTVYGLQDDHSYSYFSDQIPRPIKSKQPEEMVYYWPYNQKNFHYRIEDGHDPSYSIHFCNPEYDKQNYHKMRTTGSIMQIIGIVLFILSFIVLGAA